MFKFTKYIFLIYLLICTNAYCIKTGNVEIGLAGSYDGQVQIGRNQNDEMTFKDKMTSQTVTLTQLTVGKDDHGDLTGLGNDDHPQYHNDSRHTLIHTANFNDALSIGADVNSNVTLGTHTSDDDIHLNRTLDEIITGSWIFNGTAEFQNNIYINNNGSSGDQYIYFQDATPLPYIKWDDTDNRFEINKLLSCDSLNFNNADVANIDIAGTLDGGGDADIQNFDTIEGINSENLLDKSTAETITGDWSFQGDCYTLGTQFHNPTIENWVVRFSQTDMTGWQYAAGHLGYIDKGSTKFVLPTNAENYANLFADTFNIVATTTNIEGTAVVGDYVTIKSDTTNDIFGMEVDPDGDSAEVIKNKKSTANPIMQFTSPNASTNGKYNFYYKGKTGSYLSLSHNGTDGVISAESGDVKIDDKLKTPNDIQSDTKLISGSSSNVRKVQLSASTFTPFYTGSTFSFNLDNYWTVASASTNFLIMPVPRELGGSIVKKIYVKGTTSNSASASWQMYRRKYDSTSNDTTNLPSKSMTSVTWAITGTNLDWTAGTEVTIDEDYLYWIKFTASSGSNFNVYNVVLEVYNRTY